MPATYEPIASQTLGSATASVTFGSGGTLPQGYTDLRIVCALSSTTGPDYPIMRFNGDTGSNYSATRLYGTGSAAASDRFANSTYLYLHSSGTDSTTQERWLVDIMSYSNTNVFKTLLVAGAQPAAHVSRWAQMWRSTSAVTSIVISSFSTTFVAGSTFSLYGIKAA